MRVTKGLAWMVLISAPWCAAATIDFAVSVNLPSLYNRWGVDSQGNILIAAAPAACNLPTVNPLYSCGPLWVGKLDPTGKKLLFGTYLGSGTAQSLNTATAGIAADSNGNIIIAAHTTVQNMPTVNAFQAAPKSTFTNLYVAKLTPDGSKLTYATYLGGSGGQQALSLSVDGTGSAYVAASVTSTDFPATPQSFRAPGQYQTVVAKLDPNGVLQYAALFAFEFYTDVKPIVLDEVGRAVLVSNLEAVIVAPDGSSIVRATYPAWATSMSPCTPDTNTTWCAQPPWALPRPNGGLQFAGVAAMGVPVTADARQIAGESNSHLTIQNGQPAATQLTAPVAGFAVDPHNSNRIYAATPSGLYASGDNGSTWAVLRAGPCLAVVVDPFDSTRLYLSADAVPNVDQYPRIYRSTDGGATWTSVYGGQNQEERILSLSADPNTKGLVWGAGQALYRSTDGGTTWSSEFVGPEQPNMSPSAQISTKSQYVQADPAHAGWAYVVGFTNCIGFCGNYQDLSRTQDGGNTWASVGTPNPPALISAPVSVVIDPNNGDVIYPENGTVTVYRKGDFTKPQTLFSAQAVSVAVDSGRPGTIYLSVYIAKPGSSAQGATTGYYILQSTDDGATWKSYLALDRPAYNLAVSANGSARRLPRKTPKSCAGLFPDVDADRECELRHVFRRRVHAGKFDGRLGHGLGDECRVGGTDGRRSSHGGPCSSRGSGRNGRVS